MTREEEIVQALAEAGLSSEEIDFRGEFGKADSITHFRYSYWRRLPSDAYEAIAHLVYEDLYEDDDGDDDRGRPIIIKRWSYHFRNVTPKA
jgi:hypothetical protein